jgi:hypothetical protein
MLGRPHQHARMQLSQNNWKIVREGWGLHLVLLPKRQRCRFKQPDSGGRAAKRSCAVDECVRQCVSVRALFQLSRSKFGLSCLLSSHAGVSHTCASKKVTDQSVSCVWCERKAL